MTYGRLYEVDMRLRPSGRAGTVATSLDGFIEYQNNKAWVWEHLALTRARVVAGDAGLCDRIAAARCDVLGKVQDRVKISTEVGEMRDRIAKLKIEKPHNWPVKKPLGGVLDLELLAQSFSLLDNGNNRRPLDQFRHALAQGAIKPDDADRLTTSLNLFSKIEHLKRLLGVESFDTRNLSDAAVELFIKTTEIGSVGLIEQRIAQDLSLNAALVKKLMQKLSG
jgi:glutamate-ammonia-ligase adenylyltransferase